MKIAIIGQGNVGKALAQGLQSAGHQVLPAGHDAAKTREAAGAAEVVFLAVPFGELGNVATALGNAADGKPVVDVSNALSPDFKLALGHTTSGGEELQKKLPRAHVVKAFNTVFAQHMASGILKGEKLTVLVAADDAAAKKTVIKLAQDLGFDGVDAGPLLNSRLLEPFGFQNIQLGYVLGMGADIGFRLVH
jgi:predicted dinucleotide-binding enzyme